MTSKWIALTMMLSALPAWAETLKGSSQAVTAIEAKPQLELFTGPKSKLLSAPVFPRSEQHKGREGWVQLGMMISPEGRSYEVVITDSTGNDAFEAAALKAAEKWIFDPALMNGVPIDAGGNFKVKFALEGGALGASSKFVRAMRRLKRHFKNDNQKNADIEFEKMRVQNLYEDAFLNIARFNYYEKWGDEQQQLNALRRGIAHEDDANYLPKKLFLSALLSKFRLEVKLRDFAAALHTWEVFEKKSANNKIKEMLRKIVIDIERLANDDRSYVVTGRIGADFSWNYRLLKRQFNIVIESGEIAEIKLRCEKKYVFFRYDPKINYHISDNYGSCGIELVGNPNTKFSLVQS